MKKAVSLSFLLFSGIVIPVHAVIPHHHHDGIPVTQATAHHDNKHPDDPYNPEIVYVRPGNDRQALQLHDFDFDLLFCFTIPYDSVLQAKENHVLPFRQKPYLQSSHSDYISQSHGLRAPPVC